MARKEWQDPPSQYAKYAQKWEGSLKDLVHKIASSDARYSAFDAKTGATIMLDPGNMDEMLIFHGDNLYSSYDDAHALRILNNIRAGKKFPDANPKRGRGNPPEERPQSVIREIRKAYSDCWSIPSKWGERELEFRASKPVKAKHLYEYLKYIGGYNRFSPTRVSRMLGQIDPEAWVWVARESSVALYVSPTSQANLEAIEKAFKGYADEIDRSGDLGLRLWWD
jgi:hypothetical protein